MTVTIVLMKCPADDKDDQNDENAYAFIGTINLDIGENADLEAKVAYAHEYTTGGYENNDDIGFGAKATFNLGDITPHIAFDTSIPSGGATIPWDVGGGVKWNLSADEKSSFSTNLMMFSPTAGDSKLYVSASLVEGEGDEGALEGMGATLAIGLNDAAGDSDWNARVTVSYKVEGIKPYFDVAFGSADDAKTSFKAGLELTMISHLTTTLQYATEGHRWHRPGRSHDCPENFVLEEILFRFFGTRRGGVHQMVHPFFSRWRPGMGSRQEVRRVRSMPSRVPWRCST